MNSPENFSSSGQSSNPETGPQVPNFEQAPQQEPVQQETQNQSSPEIRLGKGKWHEVLGFDSENVSEAEINQRLRKLAMKYHPDRPGGSHEAMVAINAACDKAKKAALNGGENSVASEATMAAGAGVATSEMTNREITPEQRQAAMDAMFAADNLAVNESDFYDWHNQERELNTQHEARLREIDEDYAQRKAEDARFSEHLDKMQSRIDAEIATKKAQEKAEQEKWHRYVLSPNGPDEFAKDMQISAIKNIVMPLSESGLLSPQEMNEFMAMGRAIQLST